MPTVPTRDNEMEDNMKHQWLLKKRVIVVALIFILTGCATTLAPQYDKALFEGLTEANTDVMAFFASVSSGTQKEDLEVRSGPYAMMIGRFDALQIQAMARPVPSNKVTEKINEVLSKRGIPVGDDSEIPSATAMGKISSTLTKMRDTDKKQGVTAMEVQAFKNQVAIFLDQALTYESFLER